MTSYVKPNIRTKYSRNKQKKFQIPNKLFNHWLGSEMEKESFMFHQCILKSLCSEILTRESRFCQKLNLRLPVYVEGPYSSSFFFLLLVVNYHIYEQFLAQASWWHLWCFACACKKIWWWYWSNLGLVT